MTVQVLPDGADYESSIPYHRLVTELFLGSSRLAELGLVAFLHAPELQVILTLFVVVLLAGLSIMTFVLVTRIFGTLTPSIEQQTQQRGLADLLRRG